MKKAIVKGAEISKTMMGAYVAAYTCPHCHSELKSKESEIGKPEACPHCGGQFVLSKQILADIVADKARIEAEKEEQARQKQAAKEERARQAEADKMAREQRLIEQERRVAEQIKHQQAAAKPKKLKKCMDCGEPISTKARSCPHCGRELDVDARLFCFLTAVIGCLITFSFLFVYDTSRSGTHNIGLLSDRICGVMTGLSIIICSLIGMKR